jgi:hypothetical protein
LTHVENALHGNRLRKQPDFFGGNAPRERQVALAAPRPSADANFRYANTADNLGALLAEIDGARTRGDLKRAAMLTEALFPDENRLRRGLRDGVSAENFARILALHQEHKPKPGNHEEWAQVLGRDPRYTEILVHGATTEEIAANRRGTIVDQEFPGGAVGLAGTILRPGQRYYEVEFVPPGSSSGVKYHLFYWDGEKWAMLGPIWRAMR